MGRGRGRRRRSVDTYYARGMLEIRSTLHLSSRLAVRANQVLLRSGAAVNGAGLWLVALPGFVLLDLVVWQVLRRDNRFGLAWRLPLDALDVAFWVMSPSPRSGSYDFALLIAIALGVEAGVRLGWGGLVVPAAVLVSSSAAALAVGKPVGIVGSAWIVLAVGVGVSFHRYCRHLDERAEAQRQATLAAAGRRAFLAGQNQVAMGASSAVDAIEGMVPVLGRPLPGSALWRLADGWKSQLSQSTAQEARYLQVALLEWERDHNRHPDLSGLVEIRVAEGDGTTLLSAVQARELARALDGMGLRGEVAVRLADGDARDARDARDAALPGRALHLDVGGRRLVVPAEGRAAPPPFDPSVVAYAYVGILNLSNVLAPFGSLPVPLALALAATSAVGATLSHRWLVARGERARMGVFWGAVVASITIAALNSRVQVPIGPDGELRLGFGNAILLLSFFGGFYWRTLASRRWLLPAVIAVDIAVGIALFPGPSNGMVEATLAAVIYNLFPYFPCRHLANALDTASTRHAEAIQTVDEEAERSAFAAGRESVLGLVRTARGDAVAQLARLGPGLDPEVRDLATRRLKEVDRRLQTIDREPGLSSSTTTS